MNTPLDINAAITKIKNLHPSASIFSRVHQLISSPNAQMGEIVEIIKLDTALTADIIRLSNSGAIGRGTPASDLQTAIRRIGLNQVDHLLAMCISRSIMNQNLRCYGITAFDYWSKSVPIAILMELLAKRAKADTGEAYTIGVLHAIGQLVINQVLSDLSSKPSWDGTKTLETWEMEIVGTTAPVAGARLLKGWSFPQPFCAIIECQLALEHVENPPVLLKILNFSLRLLSLTKIGFSDTDFTLPESDPSLKEFGLSLSNLKDMVQLAKQKHLEVQNSLGMTS